MEPEVKKEIGSKIVLREQKGVLGFLNKNAKIIFPAMLLTFCFLCVMFYGYTLQATVILNYCEELGYEQAGYVDNQTACFNPENIGITYQLIHCEPNNPKSVGGQEWCNNIGEEKKILYEGIDFNLKEA